MSKPHGAFQCAGGHCPIARHVRRDCEGRSTGRRPAGGATLVDAITKRECLYGVGHEELGRHVSESGRARASAVRGAGFFRIRVLRAGEAFSSDAFKRHADNTHRTQPHEHAPHTLLGSKSDSLETWLLLREGVLPYGQRPDTQTRARLCLRCAPTAPAPPSLPSLRLLGRLGEHLHNLQCAPRAWRAGLAPEPAPGTGSRQWPMAAPLSREEIDRDLLRGRPYRGGTPKSSCSMAPSRSCRVRSAALGLGLAGPAACAARR